MFILSKYLVTLINNIFDMINKSVHFVTTLVHLYQNQRKSHDTHLFDSRRTG
tara:strand:- start:3890 stop:4045 length:156 start_codon:yes stop_codon:yes gene_type:complete